VRKCQMDRLFVGIGVRAARRSYIGFPLQHLTRTWKYKAD
jgi:hypothetical protein